MMPSENDEVAERDFRYGMLIKELDIHQISDTEAFLLHMWLSDQASEQLQEQAILTAIGITSLAEQIKICTMLEERASVLAEQFSFLNQFSALDFSLSQAFQSNQRNMTNLRESLPPTNETWGEFRERLAIDSMLLAGAARQARLTLKCIHSKKGRPAKSWRNKCFVELIDRLMELQSCTQEECIQLATSIWNNYFPDDEINSPETAGKISYRERINRKTQGQNAV